MSRDPRVRARTASGHVADPSPPLHHGHEQGRSDYFARREGSSASGATTPHSTLSNVQNSHLARDDANELQKALATFVSSAVDSNLANRKRDYVQTEARAARAEYERHQRCYPQFPVVIDQALEKQKKTEADYEFCEEETSRCAEVQSAATSDLVRLLLDAETKDTEHPRSGVTQADELRQGNEKLRLQTTTNTEDERVSGTIARLVVENEELRKRVHGLQDKLPALKQENEALRKSVYSLQDRAKMIEQDLRELPSMRRQVLEISTKVEGSLRKDIADVKEQAQTLSKSLEQGATGLESMKKSTNLRSKDFESRLEAIEEKMASLQKHLSHGHPDANKLGPKIAVLEGKVEASETRIRKIESESNAVKDELSALQQSGAEIPDRIQGLQQSLESHIQDWKLLQDDVSALKLEATTSLRSGANEDLTAQVQGLYSKVEEFTSETSRTNKARDDFLAEEIERINHDLIDRIGRLQDRLTEAETAWQDRASTDLLSSEHRKMLEDVGGWIPRLREWEASLSKLQKGLDKHTHLIQWQTHRFDNLTTETLARQIIAILSPVLPRFEEGLVKVEAELERIWKKLDQPTSMAEAEDTSAEERRRLRACEQDLARAKAEAQSEYESLAAEFRTTRDKVMADLTRLEASHSRSKTQHATDNAAIEERINDVEAQLDVMRRRLSRKDSSATSSPNNTAAPGRQNPSAIEPSQTGRRGFRQKSNGRGKGTADPDELDAEEASFLLKGFQKPPELAPIPSQSTKVPSLNTGAGLRKRSKRKRVDSPELDIESVSGSSTSGTSRVKHKNKSRNTW